MKTLEELKILRDKMQKELELRESKEGMRILVGMATCGITAGARPVLKTILEEVDKLQQKDILVSQVGCIGECALEPIVEVYDVEGNRTTYARVTSEIAKEIVATHVVGKVILEKQTIDKFK